jgi:8-oxo-dGTP pyrophosphatase MutT (NUDIX family)
MVCSFRKRANHIRQGGEVSLPGGGIEEDDRDSAHTAVREASEELGIGEDKIELAGFFGTFVGAMGVLIDAYVGRLLISDAAELPISRDEVEELFPLPFSFFLENEPKIYSLEVTVRSVTDTADGNRRVLFPAKELGLPERYHSAWEGRPHSVHVYPTSPHTLWGITAKIMLTFSQWYRKLAGEG